MLKRQWNQLFRIIIPLGLVLGYTSVGFGQAKGPYGKKYLPLYTGVTQTEVLSHLPPNATLFGSFDKFVEVKLDGKKKSLFFNPKAPGITTINIMDRKGNKIFEYRVDVRNSDLTRIVREVRGLLSDIEGITVKIVNKKVVIDGFVLLPSDLNRIYGVMGQYDKQVSSLVDINPIAQQKIAEIIERDINNPDIEVRAVNGKYILQGVASSSVEKKRAFKIAQTYLPPPVVKAAESAGAVKKPKDQLIIDLLQVRPQGPTPPSKMIQLVVHYVELSKKYLRSSSFKWAPGLSDATQIGFTQDGRSNNGGIVTEISGVIRNLFPTLNNAKKHGFARILKSSTVVVQDREQGVVSSQTQIPYIVRQPNNQGNTTQSVPVGVKATITPTITNPRSDMIKLKMLFDVSALVGVAGEAGPTVATNQVDTTVSVRSGQSAAVGGLITNDSFTEYNPDDTGSAIVSLYASKDFQKNRSQFVVFITPIIKSSASAGSEKVKRKFRLRE